MIFVGFHISIHAPVKGATGIGFAFGFDFEISIHAPVKGATVVTPSLRVMQPISIHAPVKGATCSSTVPVSMLMLFQSTLP